MKLLGSTKNEVAGDKNGENASIVENINKVVLFITLSSISISLTIIINMIQKVCVHLFQINHFINYYIFHKKNHIFSDI